MVCFGNNWPGPITSWQIDWEIMETVTDFIILGSIITADGHLSHGIKRYLLYRGKAITKLGSISKSRDITLPTKVHLVKGMCFFVCLFVCFPVVLYECEIWTIKKFECWRIDAFELWCQRRLLRVLWATRRSSQSILKEISPEYSLEGLILRLELQYFGHLMRETDTRKDHDAGEDWKQEENRTTEDKIVGWHHWHNEHEFEWALGNREGQRTLSCCSPWGRKCQTCLSNWRTTARFVMAFLPRSKHLIILWLQSPFTVIWRPKN